MKSHIAYICCLCLFSSVIGVLTSGCRETVSARYENMRQAEAAGALSKGWIPSFVPASATDVREVHDLDTNETCGSFGLPREEMQRLQLQDAPGEGIPADSRPSGWCRTIPDWQRFEDVISGAVPAFKTRLSSNRVLVGLDTEAQRVFFWRPPR